MSSQKTRVVFFGTPDFALGPLKTCFENSQLLALVCQPDKPRGRGQKITPCETRAFANTHNIPSFSPKSLKKESLEKTELLEFLKSHPADLFMVVAYGNIFPQEFLDLAPLGAVNLHASLLPRWRGAAPIQRCIEAGDQETGVCLQKMLLELDAGNVLSETRIALESEDALELSQKLSAIGADLVTNFLSQVNQSQKLPPSNPQNLKFVTFAEKIKKEEGFYRYSWTAPECLQKIRAFRAWPQVKVRLGDLGEVKLLKARLSSQKSSLPAGSLYCDQGKAFLCCSQQSVAEIETLQCPGKGPTPAHSFLKNLEATSGQGAMRVLEISSGEKQ